MSRGPRSTVRLRAAECDWHTPRGRCHQPSRRLMRASSFPSRRKPTNDYSPPDVAGSRAPIHLRPAKASGRLQGWSVRSLPLILIDLHTGEGIVGRSYLEPYLERSVRYLDPAIRDLAETGKGRPIAPLDDLWMGHGRLNLNRARA